MEWFSRCCAPASNTGMVVKSPDEQPGGGLAPGSARYRHPPLLQASVGERLLNHACTLLNPLARNCARLATYLAPGPLPLLSLRRRSGRMGEPDADAARVSQRQRLAPGQQWPPDQRGVVNRALRGTSVPRNCSRIPNEVACESTEAFACRSSRRLVLLRDARRPLLNFLPVLLVRTPKFRDRDGSTQVGIMFETELDKEHGCCRVEGIAQYSGALLLLSCVERWTRPRARAKFFYRRSKQTSHLPSA